MYTWKDVAAAQPELIQKYIQKFGPLPEGEITQDSWEPFWEWITEG